MEGTWTAHGVMDLARPENCCVQGERNLELLKYFVLTDELEGGIGRVPSLSKILKGTYN